MNDTTEVGWAAAEELMAATRRLMLAAATTNVEAASLAGLVRRIDAVSSALERDRRLRVRRIRYDDDTGRQVQAGEPWRMFPFNPFGYPLEIAIGDGCAHADLQPGALQEGPPGWLHGGFAAAFLDAVLGSLVMVEVGPSYTARLELDFKAGTLLDVPIRVCGRIVGTDGRKVRTVGWIEQNESRTVEAQGIFVGVRQGPENVRTCGEDPQQQPG